MKKSFKLALKIYKYLAIIFAIGFFIYMLIDDYTLMKYIKGASEGLMFFGGHFIYVIIYLVGGSLYYWFIVSLGILVYHFFKSKQKPVNEGN